ncbi:MAG TPA: GspE/PulE family protein [Candidatus Paceibacterota bacterium]|nr:GspE/PulE family protein [Candidatus Paceibacterota bacterium]
MPVHFDTEAEDEKLAAVHAAEEEDLARVISEKYRLPYIDISLYPVNMDALRLLPEEDARKAEALIFDKNGKHVLIALRSPENEHLNRILHDLEVRGYIIERHMASASGLAKVFERYKDLSLAAESKRGVFDIAGEELTELTKRLDSLPALRMFLTDAVNPAKRAQTSRLLEGVIAAALAMKASDIHVEPEAETIRLRFRLDGMLTDIFYFDAHAYKLLNSRLKLLSGVKLNVANRAQDGRFSIVVNDKEIEVRTSLIPGNYGESIVMRLLDPSGIERSFKDMGINEKLYNRLAIEIRRPNGMLLTTGPTGSGKTTSLYAFLKDIHTPDVKIITIEDPIEYHLPGIVQTQADGRDYTFASGLRSILRQDPDVIMVGEIRDMEVAETAIQAALTGHFVFSTLHTNNAAGAFPRLMDLGVDPKTIPSAVTVALGQRLVRTLNQKTKVRRATTDEERRTMERIFSTLTDSSLMPASFDEVWDAAPGEDDTGYKGRTGVHEAIFMDQQLADLLRMGPSAAEIEKETRRQGYLTMAQDGIIKALRGETSLDEVFKVVDVPRE